MSAFASFRIRTSDSVIREPAVCSRISNCSFDFFKVSANQNCQRDKLAARPGAAPANVYQTLANIRLCYGVSMKFKAIYSRLGESRLGLCPSESFSDHKLQTTKFFFSIALVRSGLPFTFGMHRKHRNFRGSLRSAAHCFRACRKAAGACTQRFGSFFTRQKAEASVRRAVGLSHVQ